MPRLRPSLRAFHRWLGLLLAAQLLAWFGSGLYFAWYPIAEIRGEHLLQPAGKPDPTMLEGVVAPGEAWRAAERSLGADARLSSLSLVLRGDEPAWRIEARRGEAAVLRMVSARDGAVFPALDAPAAAVLAEESLSVPGRVLRVEEVTEAGPASEIRGRPLPLWRVTFAEPERLHLYLEPWTGEIVAARTARWRVFDFLWMLHIMDYEARSDFNTPWLQLAAALALLITLSGFVYWTMTVRRRRSHRRDGTAA